MRVFSDCNLRSEHYLIFLGQKIDEKMYFFEVAIKNQIGLGAFTGFAEKKSENPTSGSASRAFFLMF